MAHGPLDREQLADPGSAAFRHELDMYRDITGTAMACLWLVTPGNGRREQLARNRFERVLPGLERLRAALGVAGDAPA